MLIVVGRAARHHRPDRAAPHAAEVRRLHEDRPGQVPGAAAAVHVGRRAEALSRAQQVLTPEDAGRALRPRVPRSARARPHPLLRRHSRTHGHPPHGPAGRRQGHPGRAARRSARACPSSPPATCSATRSSAARRSACKAKAVMEAGHLVSDDIILGVVREELGQAGGRQRRDLRRRGAHHSAGRGGGADPGGAGAARSTRCSSSTSPTRRSSRRLDRRRAIEGRADDDPAAVATRLEAYREQTAPVLAWYESAERRCAAIPARSGDGRGDRRRGCRAGARPASMITLKSPREIDIMARAGRIVAETLALDARDRPAGGLHRGPRRGGRGVHPEPRRRHAVVQGPLRLSQDALHVDRRRDRARHSVAPSGCCARAAS